MIQKNCRICEGSGLVEKPLLLCFHCNGKKCIQCKGLGYKQLSFETCEECIGSGYNNDNNNEDNKTINCK
jgi:DnaJ-class molecular chaperone